MALVKPEVNNEAGKTEAGKKVADPVVEGQMSKMDEAKQKIADDLAAGANAGQAAEKPKEVEKPKEESKTVDNALAVKTTAGELAAPTGRVTKIFQNRKDQLVAPFGCFPRIKAAAGIFKDGNGNTYGTWFDFEILSHNDLYVITPNNGDKDDDEAKACVRYSYDGITIDSTGENVDEYIAELKDKGYKTAMKKKYREVVGMLLDCEKASSVEDVLNNMVQLQLAPTSAAKLEGYVMSSSFHVARGVFTEDEAAVVRVKAKAASSNGNDWTEFSFLRLAAA
ncbi:MAG: hypothetical protein PF495_14335 [Spirochaetales bacterium]|jgi:hypothetical protein|nr:hypothetical protein [Spirochaetales bacterium]